MSTGMDRETIQERLNRIKKSNTNQKKEGLGETEENVKEVTKSNSDTLPRVQKSLQPPENKELKSEFKEALNTTSVSQEKFVNFVQKANDMMQNYEKQISYYKKRLSFYESKDLSITSPTPEDRSKSFSIISRDRDVFFLNIKKRTEEENATIAEIQSEYNNKICELFSENERLNNLVESLSFDVIGQLNIKIKKLGNDLESAESEREKLKSQLDGMESVFAKNSQMKTEIEEKDEALAELNSEGIKNIKKIEELIQETKRLTMIIEKKEEIIHEKEETITQNNQNIVNLQKMIDDLNEKIEAKNKEITEKADEIQLLYNDNIQWEEKYNLQSKEIENFKKWSLWDQNLLESFKKIDALQNEIKRMTDISENLEKTNTQLREDKSSLEEKLDATTKENKKIKDENDNLLLIKIEYDKQQPQFEEFIKIQKEHFNCKKELNHTIDKFESQIKTDQKNFQIQYEDQKQMYEQQLADQKRTYENQLKENLNIMNEKDETIKSLQNIKKEADEEVEKKTQTFSNIKSVYDKMVEKVKVQEERIQELENLLKENKIETTSGFPGDPSAVAQPKPETTETLPTATTPTVPGVHVSAKLYSQFDKYSFTKTILIDYIFCLYLYGTSINFQTILENVKGNFNGYLATLFDNSNSSVSSIQTELLEDIFFISFDKLIMKKLLAMKSIKRDNPRMFMINFEDFDKDTLNEICSELINKNVIARLKPKIVIEQFIKIFASKYEKTFDFDTKLSEFINEKIAPEVLKRVTKQEKYLVDEVQMLVELTLHNLKNGKIIINDKIVYSFEKYFNEYFNIRNLQGRSFSLDVEGELNFVEAADNISHCVKFSQPTELTMNKCFTGKSLSAVSKIASNIILFQQKIKLLKFTGNNVGGILFTTKILPMIKLMKELNTLDLTNNNLNDEDVKPLTEFLKQNKTIKIVKLRNNKITSTGGFFLADALMKNQTLECLDIAGNEINNGGMGSLMDSLTHNNTTILDLCLADNGLLQEDFQKIGEYFESNPSIDSIDLSGNTMDPRSAIILGVSMKKAKNLRYLKVNRCGLSEESTPQLLNYINETNISDIELDANSFGTTGPMMILSKMKSSSKLRRISLKSCQMSDVILEIVAHTLKGCGSIEIINLEWNKFNEKEFEKFCQEMEDNRDIVIKFTKSFLSQKCIQLAENLENIVLL